MAILVFSDTHLGIKTHSVQGSDGLTTAEREARIAMSTIYRRARQDDIEMVICCGDLFHTPHPTTRNIEFIIDWLQNMDAMDKPFYIITGNHDSGVYSNSLIFAKRLKLFNTFIIDKDFFERSGKWNGHTIYFIPFITSFDSKEKNYPVFNMIQKVISNCVEPAIIVAHVYDSDVVAGSEAKLISKYTETIDFGSVDKKITLLLGHAHRHQAYLKRNGIKVIYPGSPFYMNRDDVNQDKGYIILKDDLNFTFEKIEGLREFISYDVPDDRDAVELLSSLRISQGKHIFLNINGSPIDEDAVRDILAAKSCTLGGIKYSDAPDITTGAQVDVDNTSDYDILSSFLKDMLDERGQSESFEKVFSIGESLIEKHSQKNLEES